MRNINIFSGGNIGSSPKVMHLIAGTNLGGTERQLQQLIVMSQGTIKHVVVSMTSLGAIGQELEQSGCHARALGMRRSRPSLKALMALILLLRGEKPSVLHCWLYHACVMGTLAARLARIPRLIWGLRSANADRRDYSLATKCTIELCSKLSFLADTIAVNSEAGKLVHQNWGFATNRMIVVQNGIDSHHFAPDPDARGSLRRELSLPREAILIGMLARYTPMKDHETFFKAAALVHDRHPRVQFVLAGEGIDASNCRLSDVLRHQQLARVVHLLGPRKDIPRLTAALDIACLSSYSESFPNAIGEAMSCGVPCVGTDVGDIRRIIGDTGKVVSPKDSAQLAEALSQLVELSGEQRQFLGNRARQRILGEFPAEKALQQYRLIYEGFQSSFGFEATRTVAS